MKMISNILAATWLLAIGTIPAHSDESAPKVGFIRIINAVAPGEGKTRVRINGEDIFTKGYELGQRSGAMGLNAGTHTIAFEKSGITSGSTKITLNPGETITLIGFAEKIPTSNDTPPEWTTKILRLKQSDPERGFRMTLLSVCSLNELKVDAFIPSTQRVTSAQAKRLNPTTIDLGTTRGEVLLSIDREPLTTVSPDEPGNHVVVLYEDAEGKTRALSFFDPKFVIAG